MTFDSKYTYTLSALAFVCGWVITFIGFFVPPTGVVDQSVLFILGQALTFSGGVCGITLNINSKLQTMEAKINTKINNDTSV